MYVVAIREHGYLGRRRKVGEVYEIRSPKEATILRVAKCIRDAKKHEIPDAAKSEPAPAPSPVPAPQPIVVEEAPAPLGLSAASQIEDSDAIVYEDQRVETRNEEADDEEVKNEDEGESSPPEGGVRKKSKNRKDRRKYNRHDMVSE